MSTEERGEEMAGEPIAPETQGQRYLLDNAAQQTAGRFSGLEACFDEVAQAQLAARGIGPGWHCLEVGAGSGSIARWMAERVGPQGHVLATDIDTRWVRRDGLAQLEVIQHDISRGPVREDAFDLIHARLVLVHLPRRDAVLARLVASLKPGGWLVIEDFDSLLPHCLDPANDDERVFVKVGRGLVQGLHGRGADTTYPRTLPHRLSSAGLVEVGGTGQLTIYRGGSPAAQLQIANIDQVGDGLIKAGLITSGERDIFRRLLDDPSFVGNHPLMITAWGRKPPRY